jgi:hypothetical protein
MNNLQKCQAGCGHYIILDNPSSFKVVNHRKVCYSCRTKNLDRLKGSRSSYRTPYAAAVFNTICGMQRERKALENRIV